MKAPTFLFCVVLLTFSSGCSGFNRGVNGLLDLKTDLKVVLSADENINPDENWTPSPVYLRLYELKSDNTILDAEFYDLFKQDKMVLGDDLLVRRDLARVLPGDVREEHFILDRETRFIAIFAEFNHYEKAEYKIVVPITPHNVVHDKIVVRIENNRIKVNNR